MKKVIFAILIIVLLLGAGAYYYFNIYSERMDESDYTLTIPDALAEISIGTDKIMTCKGQAMMGRKKSIVSDCYNEYLSKYGHQFDIAAQEFFKRAKSSDKFKHSYEGKKIMMKITMQQDAIMYVPKWLKKN